MGCHCHEPEPCVHRPQESKKVRTFPNNERYPPYLPQPNDEYSKADEAKDEYGPWATGRVLWTPTAELVGVRPIVDRYTITRYSPKDWRKKNQEVLDKVFSTSQLRYNVQCTISNVVSKTDKDQTNNTKLLESRVKDVRDCQYELEELVREFRRQIVALTEMKVKLKFSLPFLKMPESIAGECIDRRSTRLESDLVNDKVEVELIKELTMINDTKQLYLKLIEEIEKQILANRACKDQLEMSWSDKKETCEWESINISLKNTTPIIAHYGGAVRFPDNQSTPESWAVFNATLISMGNEELKKSSHLLKVAEDALTGTSMQELRNQADIVYEALTARIHETEECRAMFERELQDILAQISDAEELYENLIKMLRQLDISTKVTETRLNNRLRRPRVENCRDSPEYGLIQEAKNLSMSMAEIRTELNNLDGVVSKLYEARSNLEYAIMTKRKSLYVDKELCLAYRNRYPDAAALGGGNVC